MNYIALAVPFFFLFIAIEALVARRRRLPYYRWNDSLTDLSTGILQQVFDLFIRGALFAGYLYIYRHHARWHIAQDSLLAWAALFPGVDFFYYWFHRTSHEVNFIW